MATPKIELRGVKQMGFAQAQMIADKIVARFNNNEFDICTLFFSRFKSVIQQIPTARQVIPPVFEPAAKDAGDVDSCACWRSHCSA